MEQHMSQGVGDRWHLSADGIHNLEMCQPVADGVGLFALPAERPPVTSMTTYHMIKYLELDGWTPDADSHRLHDFSNTTSPTAQHYCMTMKVHPLRMFFHSSQLLKLSRRVALQDEVQHMLISDSGHGDSCLVLGSSVRCFPSI
jgi:hypothetical protein